MINDSSNVDLEHYLKKGGLEGEIRCLRACRKTTKILWIETGKRLSHSLKIYSKESYQ